MSKPLGDPARHLPLSALEAGYAALPAPPREAGRLALITARHPEGRLTPQEARVSPDGGLEGDRWSPAKKGTLNQLTLMRVDVGELIANGQDLSLFGDNLLVSLDLGAKALPPGSRLALGDEVELEITPEPHTGCSLYKDRFGADALRFISAKERQALHLRGVHARVLRGGLIRVGEAVRVLSRGGAD